MNKITMDLKKVMSDRDYERITALGDKSYVPVYLEGSWLGPEEGTFGYLCEFYKNKLVIELDSWYSEEYYANKKEFFEVYKCYYELGTYDKPVKNKDGSISTEYVNFLIERFENTNTLIRKSNRLLARNSNYNSHNTYEKRRGW